MAGALTAADDDLDLGVDMEDMATDEELLGDDSLGTTPSAAALTDLTPVYDAAIERLRARRSGLSGKQTLGALLVGFGQPTQHGKWQEGVTNAAQLMLQLKLKERDKDESRRDLLERLTTQRDVADIRGKAAVEAARLRAAAKGTTTGRLNADQVKRLGYAKRLFPGKTDEEYRDLLYDPQVDFLMTKPSIVTSAAAGGFDPQEALTSAEAAYGPTEIAARVEGKTITQLRTEAAEAIAAGAPKDKVVQRLRELGISTEGL